MQHFLLEPTVMPTGVVSSDTADRRSQTGFLVCLSDTLISLCSKKPPTVLSQAQESNSEASQLTLQS